MSPKNPAIRPEANTRAWVFITNTPSLSLGVTIDVWNVEVFMVGLGLLDWVREEVMVALELNRSHTVTLHNGTTYTFTANQE